MFGLFRKKHRVPGPDALTDHPAPGEAKPRGVLPACVTETELVLCKAGSQVRNTGEIRHAQLLALSSRRKFILAVSHEARVDDAVVEQLRSQNAGLLRGDVTHHSVYIGCLFPDGSEQGWTLGDENALDALHASLKSGWLREHLRVGGLVPSRDLIQFGNELWEEGIELRNIDGEDVRDALLALMVAAMKHDGTLFVQ